MKRVGIVLNWVMVAFVVLGELMVNIRFQHPDEKTFFLGIPFALALLSHYHPRRWLPSLSLVSNALLALIILTVFFEIPTINREFGHYGRTYVTFALIAVPVILNVITAINDLQAQKNSSAMASESVDDGPAT